MKKVFYIYNPLTEEYERVYPSRKQRVWIAVKHTMQGIAVAAAILIALYILVDLPKEKRLSEENRVLKEKYSAMESRLDLAMEVMNDLAARDKNMYRAVMQLDPVSASARFEGIDAMPDSILYSVLDDSELVNNVTAKLALFERQVAVQSLSFTQIVEALGHEKDRLAHIPSIQPISQKDMTQMASGYGWRKDPVYGTTKHHDGMDFASPTGTPVYATGDGKVVEAGWNGAYGNSIDISHGYSYKTRYAHLSEVAVKPGQEVHRGDLIGKVGSTGKSTGSHLHYEVLYKGQPQNPVNYYFQDLTPEEYSIMVREAENASHVMD